LNAEIGIGTCPERPEGFGHVWKSWMEDSRKSCRFCGRPGRDNTPLGGPHDTGGFFAEATMARREVVGGLVTPMTLGTGKVRDDLSPAQQARADAIVEDKKRRDAEAVANGTARPGQIAGAKGKR
jgi:hypothetical protein